MPRCEVLAGLPAALSARPASPRQLILVCPADAALPAVLQAPVLLEAMSYRSGHHSTSDDSSRWVGQAGGWMDGRWWRLLQQVAALVPSTGAQC